MAEKNTKEKTKSYLIRETLRPENWEIYLPFDENSDEILLMRPICTQCKKAWSVDRKECFHCKTKYYRVKKCPKCDKIYPENVPRCANDKTPNKKTCLNCNKIDNDREVVFVPITFCWFCGNRENSFEYKIVKKQDYL